MFQLKHSVELDDLRPQITLAILVAKDVYSTLGYDLTITSANDSKHSTTSLHYSGQAIDLRVRGMSQSEMKSVSELIRERLTMHFDVSLESSTTSNAHIHIEYQPKYKI